MDGVFVVSMKLVIGVPFLYMVGLIRITSRDEILMLWECVVFFCIFCVGKGKKASPEGTEQVLATLAILNHPKSIFVKGAFYRHSS